MTKVARAIAILGLIVGAYATGVRAQAVEGAGYDRAPVRLDESVTESPRPVRPMDLLSLRDPKGVSMSPDGKQIAFVVGQADYETNGYRSGLFVVATQAGSPVRPLGTVGIPHWDDINQWIDEAPEWSPDGKWISYRTRMDASEHWQVSVWNVTTGQREKATSMSRRCGELPLVSRRGFAISNQHETTFQLRHEKCGGEGHSLQSSDSSLPSHPDSRANGSSEGIGT